MDRPMMTGANFVSGVGAAICIAASIVTAQTTPAPWTPPANPTSNPLRDATADKLVKITASADVPQVGPGEKFHLAFVFEVEPGWHFYWRNAGAGGSGTVIQVAFDSGFSVGRTLFPRPSIFTAEEGESYGYEKKAIIYVEMTAPTELTAGTANFNARINFMVCKDICLLGRKNLNVSVQTTSASSKPDGPLLKPVDPAIAEGKALLPKPLSKLAGAEAEFEPGEGNDGTLRIRLPASSHSTAQFFPVELPGITYGAATIAKEGDNIVVTAPVSIRPQNAMGNELKIVGTVGLGTSPADPAYDFDLPISRMPRTP